MRVMDSLLAFPPLILAMAVTVGLGVGLKDRDARRDPDDVPYYARLCRSDVLRVRSLNFVEAANALGARRGWIMLRHIVPHLTLDAARSSPPQCSATRSSPIAALGFVGLGAQVPTPEWGSMITDGSEQRPHRRLVDRRLSGHRRPHGRHRRKHHRRPRTRHLRPARGVRALLMTRLVAQQNRRRARRRLRRVGHRVRLPPALSGRPGAARRRPARHAGPARRRSARHGARPVAPGAVLGLHLGLLHRRLGLFVRQRAGRHGR